MVSFASAKYSNTVSSEKLYFVNNLLIKICILLIDRAQLFILESIYSNDMATLLKKIFDVVSFFFLLQQYLLPVFIFAGKVLIYFFQLLYIYIYIIKNFVLKIIKFSVILANFFNI